MTRERIAGLPGHAGPAINAAMTGFRRPGRVDGIIDAADLELAQDYLAPVDASA